MFFLLYLFFHIFPIMSLATSIQKSAISSILGTSEYGEVKIRILCKLCTIMPIICEGRHNQSECLSGMWIGQR